MVANLKIFQQFQVWDSEAAMLLMAAAIAIRLSTCHSLLDSCSGHVLLLQARSVVEYWAFLLKLSPNLWIYFSQWLYKPLNTLYYRPLLFKPLSKFCLQLRKYTLFHLFLLQLLLQCVLITLFLFLHYILIYYTTQIRFCIELFWFYSLIRFDSLYLSRNLSVSCIFI